VLEFGCNDGVLLRPLADQGIRTVIGVDPATNVVATIDDPRVTVVNDFFNETVARRIVAEHGKVDMVMANNVYAHIPDIQGITRAVSHVLNDDGVFVFEVHYLAGGRNAIRHDLPRAPLLLFAAVRDQHFERYGMVVFDRRLPIHAGSMRFMQGRR
jgi:predicted TPR repeat methyltransferase